MSKVATAARQTLGRMAAATTVDSTTLSNYGQIFTRHLDLSWTVDFAKKRIHGESTLLMQSRTRVSEIVLDTSYLDVSKVMVNGAKAEFTLGERQGPLGTPLTIKCGQIAEDTSVQVAIAYSTTEQCTALQWLTPEQTKGRKHPYMFSQCQAIHARSLMPCQDTPSVKSTFRAQVWSPLPVVMGAVPEGADAYERGAVRYKFVQNVPIPSYLTAIASGDLASCSIGPRSTVYTEPDMLLDCKWEFERDMERFIEVAEGLVFPYTWTLYNFVVLPPSFPYGGMENPNMTFATPTLVAGDRSNVDVIAHELAHSWSGNLVTNATWEHFWLNEGWTVFLERKILGRIHGEPQRQFDAIMGWNDLRESVDLFGKDHEYTKLVYKLGTNDPDDAFSTIPYEKGFNLLYHIEQTVGGPEAFEPFMPHYFEKFRNRSLVTDDFISTLYDFFTPRGLGDKLDSIDWNTWLYAPGMPPVEPNFDTTLADVAYDLASRWRRAASAPASEVRKLFSRSDVDKWTAGQQELFLDTLRSEGQGDAAPAATAAAHVKELGDIYGFAESRNAEILSRYYALCLDARATEFYTAIADWLGTVGRMKFVRPTFRSLNQADPELAVRTFRRFESNYHPICAAMVRKDLGL